MSVERLKIKNLDLINPKNALLKNQKFNDILILLRQKISEYPASYNLKLCQEFLLYCCKVVEEVVLKIDKINKKEFVIDLFKALFSLNDPECKLLGISIDFLHANNLISKVKTTKRFLSFFKKKVSSVL